MAHLLITDDTSADDLAEYLHNLNDFAKRQQCIVGDSHGETAWDRAHRKMDGALEDWLVAHEDVER